MDIEGQENYNSDQTPQSPTKSNHAYLRPSVKSRMSNQSMRISIPQTKNYPERISLQSNISQKYRQREQYKGLFEELVGDDPAHNIANLNIIRTYGSNPNDYRVNRMSDQGADQHKGLVAYEQQMAEQLVPAVVTKQKIICKCSKSKCLLMYCECFSKGLVCNQQCSCYQCRNNSQFEEKRQKARQTVLERDPNAFSNKLEIVGGEQTELAHKHGCNCKKTHCFKKYCECFNAGVKCTYLCHCQGCYNGGENAAKQQ